MSSSTVQNIEIVRSSDAKSFLDVLHIGSECTEVLDVIVSHLEDASVVLKICCTCKKIRNIAKQCMSSWLKERLPWNGIEELTVPFEGTDVNFTFDRGVTAWQDINVFASSHECAVIGLRFFLHKLRSSYDKSVELYSQLRQENPEIIYFNFEIGARQSMLKAKQQFHSLCIIKIQLILFLTSIVHTGGRADMRFAEEGFMAVARFVKQRHPDSLAIAVLYAEFVALVCKMQEEFSFVVVSNDDLIQVTHEMRKFDSCEEFLLFSTSILKCEHSISTIHSENHDRAVISIVGNILRQEHICNIELVKNCLKIAYEFAWKYPSVNSIFRETNMCPTLIKLLRQDPHVDVCKQILEIFYQVSKGGVNHCDVYKYRFSEENKTLLRDVLEKCVHRFPFDKAILSCIDKIRGYLTMEQ